MVCFINTGESLFQPRSGNEYLARGFNPGYLPAHKSPDRGDVLLAYRHYVAPAGAFIVFLFTRG
jgi:hypothetical protein